MSLYVSTEGMARVAIGICGRCSLKFPLVDLMPDPNSPGLMVCRDDVDDFDPWRLAPREPEDISLEFPRPDLKLITPVVGPPSPGVIGFDASSFFVDDVAGFAYITVTRTGGSSGAVSVEVFTVPGGTAVPGVDYTPGCAIVWFADGSTAPQTVQIPIFVNPAPGNQTVMLTMTSPTGGASLGSTVSATLTIVQTTPPVTGLVWQKTALSVSMSAVRWLKVAMIPNYVLLPSGAPNAVAIGREFAGGLAIAYSSDKGVTWTKLAGPFPAPYDTGGGGDIIYGNGQFLIIGVDGSYNPGDTTIAVGVSGDGVSWSFSTPAIAGLNFTGNNPFPGWVALIGGTYYVLVDDAVYGTVFATSSDGLTWTSSGVTVTPAPGPGVRSLTGGLVYGNGVYVLDALGDAWTGASLSALTQHAISGGPGAGNTGGNPRVISFGGLFAVIDPLSVASSLWNSPDGAAWTPITGPAGALLTPTVFPNGIQFIDGQFYYFLNDTGGNNRVFSSSDLTSWSEAAIPAGFPAGSFMTMADGDGGTYAAGVDSYNAGLMAHAPPATPAGLTWTPRTRPAGDLATVGFGNGVFIAANTNAAQVTRSVDAGVTWGTVSLAGIFPGANTSDAEYGNGVWVAVGGSASMARSVNDGVTWTEVASPPIMTGGGSATEIAYNGGVWLGIGGDGAISTQNYAISTDDGVTWSKPGLFSCAFMGGVQADASGFIGVVYVTFAGPQFYTSTDGQNFTTLPCPPDVSLTCNIAVGGGVYVSANTSTNSVRVASSLAGLVSAPDTPVPLSASGGVNVVAYGTPGGIPTFVAMGYNGETASSIDGGVTWVAGILNFTPGDRARDVTFGAGTFVAVGYNPNLSTLP